MYKIFNTLTLTLFVATSLPASATAQELAIGLGITDFSTGGEDGAVASVDYRAKPFTQRRVRSHAFAASAALTEFGDVFVGAGLSTRWTWDSGWFLESQLTPGLYTDGTNENDLGSTFQFRSVLGVGYGFDNGRTLSLAFSHISNASLADDNPGANFLFLRYHLKF